MTVEESLDLLTDSYIRRKRFEYREQAIASLNVQAEAIKAKPRTGNSSKQRSTGSDEVVFRPNSGGINYGPPPLDVFAKMGF